MMKDIWQRRLLLVSATWNIFGGASALYAPTQHFTQMFTGSVNLDDPVQLFFFRCTWINVIAWGIAYLFAAFLPTSRTAVMAAGAIGKFVYFLACLSVYKIGAGQTMLLAAGIFDVILAVLFAASLLPRKKSMAV